MPLLMPEMYECSACRRLTETFWAWLTFPGRMSFTGLGAGMHVLRSRCCGALVESRGVARPDVFAQLLPEGFMEIKQAGVLTASEFICGVPVFVDEEWELVKPDA